MNRYGKWVTLAGEIISGHSIRLHHIDDVKALANALRKQGHRGTYCRDRWGFKMVLAPTSLEKERET